MKKFIENLFITILIVFFKMSVTLAVEEHIITLSSYDITVSGAADRTKYLTNFGSSGSFSSYICNSSTLNYELGKVEYIPLAKWTGSSFSLTGMSNRNYLYDSGVPGISMNFIGGSNIFTGEMVQPAGVGISLPPEQKIAWTGIRSNQSRAIPISQQIIFYKNEERLTGTMVTPTQPATQYRCYDTNNELQEIYSLYIKPIYIHGSVTSCTPKVKTASIQMEPIPISSIQEADISELIGTKQQSFSLTCDPDIYLLYSIVDMNDPTNTSYISTLTADSTASGVGYTITTIDGKKIKFGPDGSAKDIPGQQKYLIGMTPSIESTVTHVLGFSYVKSSGEEIKAGKAKSLIGLTYSYQ